MEQQVCMLDSDEDEWDVELGSDFLPDEEDEEEEKASGKDGQIAPLKKKKLFIPPSFRSDTERLAYRKNKVMQIRLNTVLTDLHVQQTAFSKLSSSETQRFLLQRHRSVQHAERRYKRIAWQKACVVKDVRRRHTLPNINDVNNRKLRRASGYDAPWRQRGRSHVTQSAQISPLRRERNLVLTSLGSREEADEDQSPRPAGSPILESVTELNAVDGTQQTGASKSAHLGRKIKATFDVDYERAQTMVGKRRPSDTSLQGRDAAGDPSDHPNDLDLSKLPSIEGSPASRFIKKPDVKDPEAAHVRFGRSKLHAEKDDALRRTSVQRDQEEQAETKAKEDQAGSESKEGGPPANEAMDTGLEDARDGVDAQLELTTSIQPDVEEDLSLLDFQPEISKEEQRKNFMKQETNKQRERFKAQQQKVINYLRVLKQIKFLSLAKSPSGVAEVPETVDA